MRRLASPLAFPARRSAAYGRRVLSVSRPRVLSTAVSRSGVLGPTWLRVRPSVRYWPLSRRATAQGLQGMPIPPMRTL